MKRSTISVTLVMRDHRIVYGKVSVLTKCTKRHSYYGGLTFHDGAFISIHHDGAFKDFDNGSTWGEPEETLLAGRVRGNTIVGRYRRWYEIEQEPSEAEQREAEEAGVVPELPLERCGTGEPRGRTMRFVARRVRP